MKNGSYGFFIFQNQNIFLLHFHDDQTAQDKNKLKPRSQKLPYIYIKEEKLRKYH